MTRAEVKLSVTAPQMELIVGAVREAYIKLQANLEDEAAYPAGDKTDDEAGNELFELGKILIGWGYSVPGR